MQHADEVRVLLATDEKRGHLREDGPTRQRHEEGGQHCRLNMYGHCLNKLVTEEIKLYNYYSHKHTEE